MNIKNLKRAEELYQNKGTITRHEIMQLLGVSENEARIIRTVVTQKDILQDFINDSDSETNVYDEESDNERIVVTRSSDIRTLPQLIKYCKIDMTKWEAKKQFCNTWGNQKNPCFQVKGIFVPREEKFDLIKILKEFRKEAEHHAPEYKPIKHNIQSNTLLEICTHDFHFGRLSWGKETGGGDYDINIAKKLYIDSVEYFINHASSYNPSKIVFLVGSDYFNSDNLENTTTKGTRQDEDSRWKKTYVEGRKLAVAAIDICREIADVHVVVIVGNHDEQRSFFLGDSLECWYQKCNNVFIDNAPSSRKYYEYGRNLLGYTHGNQEKLAELPLIMAQEAKEAWGRTDIREIKTGHLHHKGKFIFMPIQEHQAVRVVQCSSLANEDAWTSKKGYHSIREANGNIWDKEEGNIANFNYQPRG